MKFKLKRLTTHIIWDKACFPRQRLDLTDGQTDEYDYVCSAARAYLKKLHSMRSTIKLCTRYRYRPLKNDLKIKFSTVQTANKTTLNIKFINTIVTGLKSAAICANEN